MAAQKQDDQLERTFSSYVRIQDVVLKTYLGRWTIGRSGERGSGISVLPARYDNDNRHQYNGKCRLWGDRDETINHIISEFSILAQKEYMTRHDWVGKKSTENCARNLNLTILKSGICTTQHLSWRMRHKLLWDFDIQTDNLISAKRPDIIIIEKTKRTFKIVVWLTTEYN